MPDIKNRTFIDKTKHNVFIAINFIFISILTGYGIYNILFSNKFAGIIEVVITSILYLSLYLFVKRITFIITIIMSMVTFYGMSLYLFISGGVGGTGIFWLFIIPIVYFFFLGLKWGVLLFFIQSISIIMIFILSLIRLVEIPYDAKTVTLFLIVSLSELLILISHEIILSRYQSQVRTMSGLLPICSSCKKIRDDRGYWNRLEEYIESHSNASFSHGICEECEEKLYGHMEWHQKARNIKRDSSGEVT